MTRPITVSESQKTDREWHSSLFFTRGAQELTLAAIVVNGTSFALNGANVSYRFHVDSTSGDLVQDHFGDFVTEDPVAEPNAVLGGWSLQGHLRREFPDLGRGDFRTPAVRIKQAKGFTVSDFRYKSHTIVKGKPALDGLPCTFGQDDEVSTLVIHLVDSCSSIAADLSYSIFPKHDAIVRSVKITNNGAEEVIIEKLASICVDLPHREYEMLQLKGEWTRECTRTRRTVDYGMQGYVYCCLFSICVPSANTRMKLWKQDRLLITLQQPLPLPGSGRGDRVTGRSLGILSHLHRLF